MTKTKKERERDELHVAVALDAERDRTHARKIMLLGVVLGLLLTVAGNVTATFPEAKGRALSIIVFSLAPVIAAWSLHIIYTLSTVGAVTRANIVTFRQTPFLFRIAVMVGVAVFGVALGASYEHLRTVARMGDMSGWAATAFPATIDAVLLVCTAAWFALRPASDADLRVAREAAAERAPKRESATVTAPVQRAAESMKRESPQVQPAPREPEPRVTTQVTQPVAQEVVNREPRHDSLKLAPSVNREPRHEPSSAHRDAAQRLVEARATTQDAATVAQVLSLSEAGLSTREVASAISGSQSTVRRILAAARDLDTDEERELELVS